MIIIHIFVRVHENRIDDFKKASLENVMSSSKEPGIAYLNVLQSPENPTRFLLEEAYRSADALGKHKETKHYKIWRDTVESMMAEPRLSTRYINIFPDDDKQNAF
jgi:(4S)-4-hydroxy-5-phosphonooxypentane-2,3-dione isomerase